VHTIKEEENVSVTPIKIALLHNKEGLRDLLNILSA
jgi:hypothetical protein